MVASVDEVEASLRKLIGRLEDADEDVRASLRDSLPEARTIALHVTDLDATYWTRLKNGHLSELHAGEPEESEIRITAPSDELVKMIEGNGQVFSAFLMGKVRIEASFSDMMQLRKML
jgi:putative sterol carrier protein